MLRGKEDRGTKYPIDVLLDGLSCVGWCFLHNDSLHSRRFKRYCLKSYFPRRGRESGSWFQDDGSHKRPVYYRVLLDDCLLVFAGFVAVASWHVWLGR